MVETTAEINNERNNGRNNSINNGGNSRGRNNPIHKKKRYYHYGKAGTHKTICSELHQKPKKCCINCNKKGCNKNEGYSKQYDNNINNNLDNEYNSDSSHNSKSGIDQIHKISFKFCLTSVDMHCNEDYGINNDESNNYNDDETADTNINFTLLNFNFEDFEQGREVIDDAQKPSDIKVRSNRGSDVDPKEEIKTNDDTQQPSNIKIKLNMDSEVDTEEEIEVSAEMMLLMHSMH